MSHARFSPSAAHRWVKCPASILRCEGIPDKDNAHSIAGTEAHHWLELLRGGLATPAQVPDEHRSAVLVAHHYIDSLQLEIEENEYRVDLSWLIPECFGTIDVLGVYGDVLHVIDYKNGATPVEAFENDQLILYALGALQAYGEGIEAVHMAIVQPNRATGGDPVDKWNLRRSELEEYADRYIAAAAFAGHENSPAKAGKHCKWCKFADRCPEQQALAQEIACVEFNQAAVIPPNPAELSAADLGNILQHADTIEAWLKQVRARSIRLLDEGLEVPGFKLVEGRQGNRKWGDETQVRERFGADAEITSCASPAQLEKRIGKKRFKDEAADMIVRAPGKVTLAPEGDKRPAITSAQVDFDDPTP